MYKHTAISFQYMPFDYYTHGTDNFKDACLCNAASFIDVLFFLHRVVRLSSSNLNYLIILGAVCMYLSVYAYLVPTVHISTVQIMCTVCPKNVACICSLLLSITMSYLKC